MTTPEVTAALAVLTEAGWSIHSRVEYGVLTAGLLVSAYDGTASAYMSTMAVESWRPADGAE